MHIEPIDASTLICVKEPTSENPESLTRKVDATVCNSSADSRTHNSLKMMKVELELKRAQLKKEQLEKERLLMEQDFNIRTQIVDAEIKTLKSLLENNVPSNLATGNSTVHHVERIVLNSDRSPSSPPLEHLITNSYSVLNGSVRQEDLPSSTSIVPGILPSTPLGLQQLQCLDHVTIRQLRSQELGKSYEVVGPLQDLVIFRVNITANFVGQFRMQQAEFIDSQVKEVAHFQTQPNSFIDLFVCGQLACKVKRSPTYFKPMLVVQDSRAQPTLKIKGPNIDEDPHIFHIQTMKKKSIGRINMTPAVPSERYEVNHAIVEFPIDLDVRFKVALIASKFLIVNAVKNTWVNRWVDAENEMRRRKGREPLVPEANPRSPS